MFLRSYSAACLFRWWLLLICSEKKCYWLVASGSFILREKYCWPVADKPDKQGATSDHCSTSHGSLCVSEVERSTAEEPFPLHTMQNLGGGTG
jgi:hypothetical protein